MMICSIDKKIESCGKCEHSKPHDFNTRCKGTCFGKGHTDEEGKPAHGKIVACIECPESIAIPESIAKEEL